MPLFEVSTPDGRKYEVNAPDGATQDDAISYVKENLWKPKEEKLKAKDTMGTAFQRGLETMGSQMRTGVSGLLNPTEAAIAGQQRGEDIQSRLGPEESRLEKVKRAYEEKGLLPAIGTGLNEIPKAISEQAPQLATAFGSARLGAMAGAPFGPYVAGGGALVGMFLPSFFQQYGGNIERQADVQKETGQPIDIKGGRAALAATPQAVFDVAENLIPFGGKIASGIFGPSIGKLLSRGMTKEAEELAVKKLSQETFLPSLKNLDLGTVVKGTGKTVALEMPTEIAQQMLERKQAGLDLFSKDALKEYGETAFDIALLGPLGIYGRVSDKSAARKQLLDAQKEAAEIGKPVEVPLQLGFDPNVSNTKTIIMHPDGSTSFPSEANNFYENPVSELSKQGLKEAYAPQQGTIVPPAPVQAAPVETPPVIYGNTTGEVGQSPEEVQQAEYFKQQALTRQAQIQRTITPATIKSFGIGNTANIYKDKDVIGADIGDPIQATIVKNKLLSVRDKHTNPLVKQKINEFLSKPEFSPEKIGEAAQPIETPTITKAQAPVITSAKTATVSNGVWQDVQNRDRTTPASINQMNLIASNPSYDRASFSNSFSEGAPVVSGSMTIPENQLGRKGNIVTGDNQKIPVQYAVIDASQVMPSHNVNGSKNLDYVSPDYKGLRAITNGRVAGLQAGYARGTMDDYVTDLTHDDMHGISKDVIKGIKNPMLVRVMPQESINKHTGDVSNTGSGLSLNVVEQAKNDINRINLEGIQFNEDGEITEKSVRDFIRAMPQTEQNNLITKDGAPSKQAYDRLNAAIFQQAYQNDKLTELAFQSPDEEIKNIVRALNMAAPVAIHLDGLGDYDVRPYVNEAVEMAINAKRNSISLSNLVKQSDMTTHPLSKDILEMFANNPRSAKAMGENLNTLFNDSFKESTQSADMFGEVQKKPIHQVIKDSFTKKPEEDLFTPKAELKELSTETNKQPSKIKPEEQKLEAELKGKTLLEVAKWSVDNSPNKFAKIIANMVDKRLNAMSRRGIKFDFEVQSGNERQSSLYGARGSTKIKIGKIGEETSFKITLNGAAVFDNQRGYPSGMNYKTIVHELLHVATRGQLALRNSKDPLVIELNNLRNQIVKDFNKRVKEGNLTPFLTRIHKGEINTLADADELISWGLTDRDTQEYFSEIKVGEKTIFNKLVDIVRQLLGISKDYETALDRLVRTSESILNEDVKNIAGRLEGVGYSFGKSEESKGFTGEQKTLFEKFNKQTNKFKRWFGNSKITNEDGSPMVLYHATAKDLSILKPGGFDVKMSGPAIWMSDKSDIQPAAHNIGSRAQEFREGTNVMPLYAKIENPLVLDDDNMLNWARQSFADGSREFPESMPKEWADAVKSEGYDGIIYSTTDINKKPYNEIIAFNSNQIKSAIGNNGEFNAENPDIRYELSLEGVNPATAEKIQSIFGPTKKSTIKEKFKELKPNFYNRVITGLFDEFRPIKNYGDEAYMKAVLSKTTDGALEGLLMHGHVTLKDGALDIKQGTKGLLDILKPLGADVERYQVWKALNRDANLPENKRSFKDLIPQRNELLNGNINGVPRKDIYQKVLNEENKLNKSVLDVAKAQGTIDDEAYERFSNDIYYIPFYKAMENGDIVSVQDSSKLTGQYFSKALKGGEKEKMGDLMENTLRNWSHILSASMKNAAAISTLDSAVKLEAAEEVKSTYEGKNVLTVMKNGKKAYYAVTDPNLVESISMISFLGPKSPFLDVAKGFTNALRVGVTLAPGYKLRNLIRDTVSSAAISPVGMNVLDNVQRGLKLSNKGNPTYVSAMAGGGVFELGAAHEGNQAALVKRLIAKGVKSDTVLSDVGQIKNVLKDMYEKYNEFGNKFENANRLALYDKMIKEGKSHLEASYAARDLLNFTGQGSWRAVKTISQVVPFFNTRLQGLYKLGRDGISPTSRVLCNMATGKPIEESDKLKAQRFSIVSTAVALASIGLYMAYKDDDDFKKREDWDRDNFWWFKVGDTAFRIPKPFEIGALGTIAERSVEQLEDENVEGKVFVQRLHSVIMDNLSMNPTPQFIKPMIDLYANKDSFTGAPIETSGMERLSKQERYTNNTSELAKALGGVTEGAAKILTLNPDAQGFSPIQMDYALKGYLGWLGSTVASVSDKAVQPWSDVEKPSKPSLDQYAMGFAKSLPETQSKFVTEFYDNSKRINEAFADMKRFAEHGEMEKVANIMAEKGNLIALQNVYNQTTTQMAEYRKYINIITTDKKMSKEDKENEITRMKLLISQLAENAETMRKSLNKK